MYQLKNTYTVRHISYCVRITQNDFNQCNTTQDTVSVHCTTGLKQRDRLKNAKKSNEAVYSETEKTV